MWLTLAEVAKHLRVSKETIYKMAQKGQLPGSKLGNQWRFNQHIVDEYLKNHSNTNNVNTGDSENEVNCSKEFANG